MIKEKKFFPKSSRHTTGHNLFSTSFKNDTPNHLVTMVHQARYLRKYPDSNVWWGWSNLTGLYHTALQLLCYFHREGRPVVQKKSKQSCLGKEGHGLALSFSLTWRNDHFITVCFFEYLEVEKFLYEVIKITNILHIHESEFDWMKVQK